MIEHLNTIARLWWDWSAAMFWQVGLLIVLIAALDRLVRRWAWPQLRYALWSLILIKLILPPSLSLPSGIVPGLQPVVKQAFERLNSEEPAAGKSSILLSLNEEMLRIPPTGRMATTPFASSSGGIVKAEGLGDGLRGESVPSSLPVRESGAKLASLQADRHQAPLGDATWIRALMQVAWQAYAMIIWLTGTIVLGLWLILRLHSLAGRQAYQAAAASLPQSFYNQLAGCAKRLGLRRVPRVVVTRRLASPAVFGVLRPVLLMPKGYLSKLSRRDTEHMLLHELAHIKRGDLMTHGLYMLLQILYWYNPLLWLVRRQMHHLRELSCDATVAELLRERTPAYRQTLLETARRLLTSSVEPGLGLLGLFEDSNRLLVRLNWLTKPTWRYRTMKRVTVATIAALMLTCVLPMAQAQEAASNEPASAAERENSQQSQDQLSQDIASLQARLEQLMAQQQQLQEQLRALGEKRDQVAAKEKAKHSDPSVMVKEKAPRGADVMVMPHEAPAQVDGDQPGTREEIARAHAEQAARAQAAVRKARQEAERAVAEARRRAAEGRRAQAEAQRRPWAEQMQQWQKDMERWQQQMQEWAHAQAQRSMRAADPMYDEEPPAPATVPPMPPVPEAPAPMDTPDPLEKNMAVEVRTVHTPEVSVHVPEIHVPHIAPPHIEMPAIEPPVPPAVPEHDANLEKAVRHIGFGPIPGDRFLEVVNHVGSITVRSGDKAEYVVRAIVTARAETKERADAIAGQLAMMTDTGPQADGWERIIVSKPEGLKNREGCVVTIELTAPRNARLKLRQDVGDIHLAGLQGSVEAFDRVGSIRAVGVSGQVALNVEVGDIDFAAPKDLSAKVQARANLGDIKSDLPLEFAQARGPSMGDSASGTIGRGDDNVSLNTRIGSIRIRTQASESEQGAF